MSKDDQKKKEKKAALKNLRNARKEWINRTLARLKIQNRNLKAIKGYLKKGAGTVPQIAEATGVSSDKVLWYIAALKKYGEVDESEKDGSYFRYTLTEKGLMEDSGDEITEPVINQG
jgi:predicted transcriptional regulator